MTARKHSLDRLFNSIVAFKEQYQGATPKLRWLMEECDVSSTSVMRAMLEALEREGQIERVKVAGNRYATVIKVEGARWLSPDEAQQFARFEAWLEEQEL
jgi:hypothetical protein